MWEGLGRAGSLSPQGALTFRTGARPFDPSKMSSQPDAQIESRDAPPLIPSSAHRPAWACKRRVAWRGHRTIASERRAKAGASALIGGKDAQLPTRRVVRSVRVERDASAEGRTAVSESVTAGCWWWQHARAPADLAHGHRVPTPCAAGDAAAEHAEPAWRGRSGLTQAPPQVELRAKSRSSDPGWLGAPRAFFLYLWSG